MLFDLLDRFIPIVIIFMLLRGILSVVLGKKRRRRESEEYPEDSAEYDYEDEADADAEYHTEGSTPADIFEQKMRDKEKAQQAQEQKGIGGGIVYDGDRVLRDSKVEKDGSTVRYGDNVLKDGNVERDGSTVRYGNTVLRDASVEKDGSIVYGDRPVQPKYKPVHVENCQLQHERGNVYREYEPQKDIMGKGCVPKDSQSVSKQVQSKKRRFKNTELVRGIVLGEVLGKPRALKPYGKED